MGNNRIRGSLNQINNKISHFQIKVLMVNSNRTFSLTLVATLSNHTLKVAVGKCQAQI
jgi:hypothetical protein